MLRIASRTHRPTAPIALAVLLVSGLGLVMPDQATAEVVRNTGGGAAGVNKSSLVCQMFPDYGASKPPDVDPVIVVGIGTKDDTGGHNPARIGSVAFSNGVDPLEVITRGEYHGLTPAHEELDNMQVNRIELWALPFLRVPHFDQGAPLKLKITFIDENGAPISVSDVIAGCGLFNGVAQDRPVTGHGGGDVGFPGTDFPFSLLPCSVDGMATDGVVINGDMGITGPALPGQIPGAVDLETGVTEDDLRAQSSYKVLDDENCLDGFTFMAWQLDQPTTWVTAALSLEPEEDCYVALKLGGGEVAPGGSLNVEFRLQHNRWQPVTVPIKFWINNEFGDTVLEVVTAPRTFEHGEMMHRKFLVHIPQDLAPGNYTLAAGAERMQQGLGWASKRFKIVEN